MGMTLHQIGLTYGTDKAKFHGYCDFYEERLSDLKHGGGILLELGVLNGASLRMWRDWLPNLTIVGWDIEPKAVTGCFTDVVDCGNIDAMNAERMRLRMRGQPIRCIIDDASHQWAHQRAAFMTLFPHTLIYIIEDLHTSMLPQYGHAGIKPVYDGKTFDLPIPAGTQVSVFKGKANDSWTAIFRKGMK